MSSVAQPQAATRPSPMVTAAARELCRLHAEECHIDQDDMWMLYGQEFTADAEKVLKAAGALRMRETLDAIATALELLGDYTSLSKLARGAIEGGASASTPKCARCGGTRVVDDGEIDRSAGGTPFMNGPIKCVKDCPACSTTTRRTP